ncbi:kinase-like domain-containing protein [Zopfochytrium polystomum]|nr:kinase-like domain-containing protein [Zopfochytrium polystomum]
MAGRARDTPKAVHGDDGVPFPTSHLSFDLSPGTLNVVLIFNGTFAPLHLNHLRVVAGVRRHFATAEGAHVAGAYLTPVSDKRAHQKLGAVVDEALAKLPHKSRAPNFSPHAIFAPSQVRFKVISSIIRDSHAPEEFYTHLPDPLAAATSDRYSAWLAFDPWQATRNGYAAGANARVRTMAHCAFDAAVKNARDVQNAGPPPRLRVVSIGGADALSRMKSPSADFVVVGKSADELQSCPPHVTRVVVPQADGLSSTTVRSRLLLGQSVDGMVDPAAVPALLEAMAEQNWLPPKRTLGAEPGDGPSSKGEEAGESVTGAKTSKPSPLYLALMSHKESLTSSNALDFLFWLMGPDPASSSPANINGQVPPIFGPFHACPQMCPTVFDFATELEGPIDAGTRLGAGRAAPAYRMRLVSSGADVAVKLYDLHARQLKRSLQSYSREVLALSSCRSPHVVRLIGFGVTRDYAFMVLELADMGNLSDVLQSSPALGLGDVLSVLRQVALGLARLACEDDDADKDETCGSDAHARTPWIHRDLSTDNILLSRAPGSELDGRSRSRGVRAVVSDFTQAKPLWDGSRVLRGACRRYAPEALRDVDAYTSKSDVFSFGVVMYEACHGVGSFWAALSTADAVKRTVEGRVPDWDADVLVEAFWAVEERKEVQEGASGSQSGGLSGEGAARRLRESLIELGEMVIECWRGVPEHRPSFLDLAARLRELQGSVEAWD